MRSTFATFRIPETPVTDNGSNFTSSEFEEFLKANGICHIKTAPYHPASNGLRYSPDATSYSRVEFEALLVYLNMSTRICGRTRLIVFR